LLANRGKPVVDGPAERPGLIRRQGLNPAERTEERQHARLHPLAVHPSEMEIDVIEGLGERLLAHPRGLQHLDTVRIAHNARFPGTSAQGAGYFGGPPMGTHVDHGHGCFLHGPSGSLTPRRLAAKYDNRQDRSMTPADHVASCPAEQNPVGIRLTRGDAAASALVPSTPGCARGTIPWG